MQDRLDGGAAAAEPELALHLESCPQCQTLHAAASRLEAGMQLRASLRPPDGLRERIVARVLAARRTRLRDRRRIAVGLAIAAGLTLVVLGSLLEWGRGSGQPAAVAMRGLSPRILDRFWRQWPPAGEVAEPTRDPPESPDSTMAVSMLREHVTEAGAAVADLTRRTAAETLGQTRLLIPVVMASPSLEPTVEWTEPLESPMRSLREAGLNVTAGLEPVTTSARRAIDLFWREIPPVEQETKPGF